MRHEKARALLGLARRLAASAEGLTLDEMAQACEVGRRTAERMRDALGAAGRRCVVRFFEGESHGFRRAETLVACLEEELAFYRTELRL